MSEEKKAFRGLSGNMLKAIALTAMVIDHIGLVIVAGYASALGVSIGAEYNAFYGPHSAYFIFYYSLRFIGRIAFPIFAFLLVEGAAHTKDIRKYIARMGLFALVSEIPYDLSFYVTKSEIKNLSFLKLFTPSGIADVLTGNIKFNFLKHHNVFFTLTLALIAIAIFEQINKTVKKVPLKIILTLIVGGCSAVAAYYLGTDYGLYGVICVFAYYWFRSHRLIACATGGAILISSNTFLAPSLFSAIPILMYNGERGKRSAALKWCGYMVYPVHLAILGVLRIVLKI